MLSEGLGEFFENLGKKRIQCLEKHGKKALKNPGRTLENGASLGSAFASQSRKTVSSSLSELIKFFHTEKGLYLGKFVKVVIF